jgi:hypothetical protein
MAMWFWVYDIMHSTLKNGENFPPVKYNNKMYYQRSVNGPKLWDTRLSRERSASVTMSRP